MAATNASWTDLGNPPSLAAMSLNDTKTISGKCASISRLRQIIGATSGGGTTAKAFSVVKAGYQQVLVKRTK